MTIRDILDLFIDESCVFVRIYDLRLGEQVFEGYGRDVPEQYEYCEISTIDNPEKNEEGICFNIETTE